MTAPENTDSIILLQGIYSYRNVGVLLTSLFFLSFGVVALVIGLSGVGDGGNFDTLGVVIGLVLIAVVFGVGGRCLALFIRAVQFELIITDRGVRYGSSYWAWSRIRWISRTRSRSHVHLKIQSKGFLGHDILLAVNDSISRETYEKLAADLERLVRPHCPELQIL